ncbi:MAG: alpha/beta hydrolase family protein [Acidimicrobiales bacterium]
MPIVERLTFIGSQGASLQGRLHVPEGKARGSILMAHCFTCSKDIHTMTRLAHGFAEGGYAALRFDFTGLGDSGGDFADTSVSANVADLTRATLTLIQRGYGPCGLVGHSLGGSAALLAAQRLKTVRSVVTIGAPSDPDHVRNLFSDNEQEIRSHGRAEVNIGGRSFCLAEGFLNDLEEHDVLDAAQNLNRPLLVVHARDDTIVEYAHGQKIYDAAKDPKRLVTLENADHLVTGRDDAEILLTAILDWFDETL